MALATLLILVGAYAAGGRAAQRSAELSAAQRNINMQRKKDRVVREIDGLDDAALRHRAQRWVRGSKQ